MTAVPHPRRSSRTPASAADRVERHGHGARPRPCPRSQSAAVNSASRGRRPTGACHGEQPESSHARAKSRRYVLTSTPASDSPAARANGRSGHRRGLAVASGLRPSHGFWPIPPGGSPTPGTSRLGLRSDWRGPRWPSRIRRRGIPGAPGVAGSGRERVGLFMHPPRHDFIATMSGAEWAAFDARAAWSRKLLAGGLLIAAGPCLGRVSTGIAISGQRARAQRSSATPPRTPGYPGCIAAPKRDMRSSETGKVPSRSQSGARVAVQIRRPAALIARRLP